jgi:hypothetical protein
LLMARLGSAARHPLSPTVLRLSALKSTAIRGGAMATGADWLLYV